MEKYYRFANHDFLIKPVFAYFFTFAKDYEISNSDNAIKIENSLVELETWQKDREEESYPLEYIETLLIHSKIADELAMNNIFIFHGSSIYVDNLNNGFVFTAKSGVGKSTHVSLLKKTYGDRVNFVNDDKPFISINNNKIYIYGSPWSGKGNLSNNVKARLRGIFLINRSLTNKIEKIAPSEAFEALIKQIHFPDGLIKTNNGIELIKSIIKDVPIFKLFVNMNEDAPKTSMNVIEKIIKE